MGAPVIDVRNQAVAAVHGLEGIDLTPVGAGWQTALSGPYAGAQYAIVGMNMTVARSPEAADLAVGTVLLVYVRPLPTPADSTAGTAYALYHIYEYDPAEAQAAVSLGSVALTYMSDPGPTAALETTYTEAFHFGAVTANASASSDNAGPSNLQYRWRLGGGDYWTEWGIDSTTDWEPASAGDHLVSVQVRDRWGQVSEASQTVVATEFFVFADSPEQLMANFQTVYEDMDILGYREVIDSGFVIYLSQDTIDEYSLPREFFDYDEEVQITDRMFSGNARTRPNGDIIPGITRIQFNYFQPEAAWADSPPDHRIPNAIWAPFRVDFTIEQGNEGRLNIKGIIEFYLNSEQVEHQGRIQTKYSMIGQMDYTGYGSLKRPTTDVSWSDVKALYH